MTLHFKTKLLYFCRQNKLQSYDIIEKECDFNIHMIYYLCFYALLIKIYADRKKL